MKKLLFYLLLFPLLGYSQSRTQVPNISDPNLQTEKLQSLISSNKRLFFSAGMFIVNKRINIEEITNLTFEGEPGTIIVTNQTILQHLYGNNKKIASKNIKFISIDANPFENSEGIITNNNLQGSTGTLDGLSIDNCEFTKLTGNGNAIKINAEGSGFAKNIKITHSRFINIGRFAIETQNHIKTDKVVRVQNVEIIDNYFQNIGTMGTWGVAISISGYSNNVKVNYNTIIDVGSPKGKTVNDYYGIENAGASNWQSNGNHIISKRYGFKGILCSNAIPKTNVVIENNTFDLQGEKTNAIEMNNVSKAVVRNNYTPEGLSISGLAFLLNNVSTSIFSYNKFVCNYPAGYMIQQGSTKNKFSDSYVDNTLSNEKWGTVIFLDAGTTGNTFTNMTVKGGGYSNLNGATNATNF